MYIHNSYVKLHKICTLCMTQTTDARHVTFKECIGMPPYQAMYGEKRDDSDFRAFGCRAWVYLDKQRQEKGKHMPRAKEAVYVGFADNISVWAFWISERQENYDINSCQVF